MEFNFSATANFALTAAWLNITVDFVEFYNINNPTQKPAAAALLDLTNSGSNSASFKYGSMAFIISG